MCEPAVLVVAALCVLSVRDVPPALPWVRRCVGEGGEVDRWVCAVCGPARDSGCGGVCGSGRYGRARARARTLVAARYGSGSPLRA